MTPTWNMRIGAGLLVVFAVLAAGQHTLQRTTLASGSVWDIAFSKDPQRQFIYLADGSDEKVFILRRAQHRDRLEGEHLHDRNLRGQARAAVHLQGTGAGDEAEPGDDLAGFTIDCACRSQAGRAA